MEYLLARTPIPGMLLWAVLYVSDYYMTLATAKGYKEIGVINFEKSFELTPQFQKDVDGQARISRRHLFYLFSYELVILVLWLLFVELSGVEWLYSFFVGALVLLEVTVHMRHFRNWHQIRVYKREGGISGSITFGQRFSYLNSAFDLYSHAVLFLFFFLITFSPFFLGGAVICFTTGVRHSRYAGKAQAVHITQTVDQNADSSSR